MALADHHQYIIMRQMRKSLDGTASWQSKYGRDPTDQQRSWLVNKIRTDVAMMGIKLNAQVMIKSLYGPSSIMSTSLSKWKSRPAGEA